MPGYNTRRYRRRGGRRATRSIAWKKPTASNQKNQIYSLQKQVNSLVTKNKQVWQYTKFDFPMATVDLLPPVVRTQEDEDSFNVFPILQPNNWQEVFSSQEQSVAPKTAHIKYLDFVAVFTPKNSLTPLTQKWVNVWLVSLHKEAAAQILDRTDDLVTDQADNGLNASAQGEYYNTRNSDAPFSSLPRLNPKVFKIKAHRRFTLQNIMQEEMGDDDVAVVDPDRATQYVSIKQRLNTKLSTQTGSNSRGQISTWKNMTESDTEQTDRLYIITHIGGYGDDGDNGVNMASHCTFTVKTPM